MIVLETTLKLCIYLLMDVSCRASVATKFVKKVEARVAKLNFVDKVKLMNSGNTRPSSDASKDRCTSNRLLDDSSVAVLDVE